MLQVTVDWFTYSFLGLTKDSGLGQIINFFLYDIIKILFLLSLMITVMAFLRTWIPQKKVKAWLKNKKVVGNIAASGLGALTPFCSCSSIPLFLSFLELGVPLGITFSFLVTSPLINEYLVVLMLGFFGLKVTLIYIVCGMFIGVVTGLILGKIKMEKYLVSDLVLQDEPQETVYNGLKDRLLFGIYETKNIIKRVWLWLIIAIGIGAIIHNYVPGETIQNIVSLAGFFAVPIAVILGVPMYGSCAAIVPIALVLFQKGVPLGTALAFMMAVSALSLPQAIMLRRAMQLKLLALFFGVVTIGIICIGYLINMVY